MIASSAFLGAASALADGDAAYLLWIIGFFSIVVFLVTLRTGASIPRWLRVLQSVALLALPALLLLGMVVSMFPPA
ncbi:hypothetical protein [Paraburkholderia tagetis]|uniref:Uncharacterized protein n=1 Tax=Paraburkholderia tagetis TaxID=2913261 RepID=A0A9X1RQT7_9BURK|nr:hypothetical protein [Paraburkholderia tagetis]MCG5074087.1 hypothetical protein [Paraburkholderia tagetis]